MTSIALRLAGRSLLLIPRIPSTFVPSVVMPVVITLAFSGTFGAITQVQGFPTDEILDWIAPMALLQGAAFAGITTGMGVARDVESGFYDRFLASPASRRALLAGPLLASAARAVVPYVAVLAVGLAGGARFRSPVAGPLVLLLMSTLISVAAGAWSLALVYRFRSLQVAPLMQSGLFMVFFLSTAQVPLAVMTGWLHGVARINPMTNVLRAGRQGFLGDISWAHTWPGVVAAVALAGLLTLWAARGLRRLTA